MDLIPRPPVGTVLGMAHNTGPADRLLPPQAFFKPAASVVGPGAAIELPEGIGAVEPEAEIAVVIGATCRHLRPSHAEQVVLGWTVADDVTARELQRTDPLWMRAKGYDTFTPLGSQLAPGLPPADQPIELHVNGRLVSAARLDGLARDVGEILAYLTSYLTLRPGDVVLTGAPGAAVPIAAGDDVVVRAPGVPYLANPVAAASVRTVIESAGTGP